MCTGFHERVNWFFLELKLGDTMEKQGPSALRIALIVLGAIYLTLFILVGIAWLFTTNITNLFLVIVGISAIFVAYSMYTSLRKRQWTVFAIIAILVGVLILTSSTLAIVPYSTAWTYKTQYSYNVLNETASMKPNETISFEHDFRYYLELNSTLVQVRLSSSSNDLDLLVYATQGGVWGTMPRPEPILNESYWTGQLGWGWESYYWAPAGPLWQNGPNGNNWGNISFVDFVALFLTNHDNSSETVYLQLDVFYNGNAEKLTTNYRPLIATNFALVGIGLVGVAVVVEAYPSLRFRRKSIDTARSASGNASATERQL